MKWEHLFASMTLCLVFALPAMAMKPINVNPATVTQLEQAKGIGETLAKRIVAYRSAFKKTGSADARQGYRGENARAASPLPGSRQSKIAPTVSGQRGAAWPRPFFMWPFIVFKERALS